jgi:hypothetical protein
VPAVQTPEGVWALKNDKPISPENVEHYLGKAFGDDLEEARKTMQRLAAAMPPADLARHAYQLYEQLWAVVPADVRGWGAKGEPDLAADEKLAGSREEPERRPER